MSEPEPSYRLETPRRPPPPPLRIPSNKRSSTLVGSASSPSAETTLLYDVPSATPRDSTPRSPDFASPTSPTRPGRSRVRASRQRSSPHPSQPRSPTPSRVKSDLEAFAEQCRRWFFDQDEQAGQAVTQTLATLPSNHRAPFVRLQASIRSAYHASVNERRNAEFRAHLSATHPGGSLMPHARAHPKAHEAKKERFERFDRFLQSWCTMGFPGTRPFFEGLWTLMRLQVLSEDLGGAGAHRIEWEIDDSVFKEAAGKDFMLEAIDVLKGVLAFEDTAPKRTSTSTSNSPVLAQSPSHFPLHTRWQSQPLQSKPPVPARHTQQQLAPQLTPHAKRARAPSDPFLDAPALPRSLASSTFTNTSSNNTVVPLSESPTGSHNEPPSPNTPPADDDPPALPTSPFALVAPMALPQPECEDAYMRTWLSPDLDDPELLELLKAFPSFISKRTLPRFVEKTRTRGRRRPADIEQGGLTEDVGEGEEDAKVEVRAGTGRMWISGHERSAGWEGSWWVRFKLWWRRLFC